MQWVNARNKCVFSLGIVHKLLLYYKIHLFYVSVIINMILIWIKLLEDGLNWKLENLANLISKFDKFITSYQLISGTRESAYLWALTSAGAAWGVATACSQGWLPDCSCSGRDEMKQNWEWGGCSYGVQFGIVTSRKLLTRSATSRSPLRKLEKHNLKAGRLVRILFPSF